MTATEAESEGAGADIDDSIKRNNMLISFPLKVCMCTKTRRKFDKYCLAAESAISVMALFINRNAVTAAILASVHTRPVCRAH